MRTRVCLRILAAIVLSAVPATNAPAQVERTINDLRLGFQSTVKLGYWIPVAVDLQSKGEPFTGALELTTADSDGLATSLTIEVFLDANEQKTIHHYVKIGRSDGGVVATLRDKSGQEAARREFLLSDERLRINTLPNRTALTAYFGNLAGLYEAVREREAGLEFDDVARILTPAELPTQWIAYDSVTQLVMSTHDPQLFDQIDPLRAAALRTWVRQGGRLVLCVGRNWQVVAKSFLGDMLPAKPVGVVSIRTPTAVETFAKSKVRLDPKQQGLSILRLADNKGKVQAGSEAQPFIVDGAYGLGMVTLVGFDADVSPFREWEGKREFWFELLRFGPPVKDQAAGAGFRGFGFSGASDAATFLHGRLEYFPEVTIVDFKWVALLIFGYILLIGPFDYFFLKRVVGRLEWTWVTFPTMVLIVSVSAYFAAYWLKGDELRVNRIEVVDVDQDSRTLRGSGFLAIFSPRIARYSVAEEPGLMAGGRWSELGMGREPVDRNASWLGLPEEYAFRGMGSPGSASLFGRRGYAYSDPSATGLIDVPIQVWSVKTFNQRWLAEAGKGVRAELKLDDAFVTGVIHNDLAEPLENVVVCYGNYVQQIPRIEPGKAAEVVSSRITALKSFLSGARFDQTVGDPNPVAAQAVVTDAQLRDQLLPLFFGRKIDYKESRRLASRYLFDLDLSDLLDVGKVVILSQTSAEGGRLWLDKPPARGEDPPTLDGVSRTQTFLRLVVQPKG